MSDKLKPCPFCGSEPQLIDARLGWYVQCATCDATVVGPRVNELNSEEEAKAINWGSIEQAAIDKWNTRKALKVKR